jgi:hypothetical protein
VPDDRDPADDDRTITRRTTERGLTPPTLGSDDGGTVGFLDAPRAEPDDLVAAVVAAFNRLADGAVLTVHSLRTDLDTALALLRDEHRIAVIASIPHPTGGTTLTLRR